MSTSSRKTAIITGGTRGIGEAITKLLHSKGFNVVVTYGSPSSAEPAGKLVSTLGSSTALAVQSDASSLSSIDDLIKTTTEKFGNTIDAVIANAGIMPMKDIEHTTPEDFDAVMNVNVKGPYFLVQVSNTHSSHLFPLLTPLETTSSLPNHRRTDNSSIHNPHESFNCSSRVLIIQRFQRSNRTNDTCTFQRFNEERNNRQLCVSRSYCNQIVFGWKTGSGY